MRDAEPAPAPAREVIAQVPGVMVDLLVTLPDGGKARSAHYARLGSHSLGRTRIASRNLMLGLDETGDGVLVVSGNVTASADLPEFAAAAPEGGTTEWSVPLGNGAATVRVSVHREDVPA